MNKNAKKLNEEGREKLRRGEYSEAVEYFKKAVEIEPGYIQAWHNLGLSYIHQEKFENAIPPLLQAVKISPSYTSALIKLAFCYHKLGEINSAIRWFKRAETTNPSDKRVEILKERIIGDYLAKASLHYNSENYSLAMTYFGYVLELDNSNIQARYGIALSLAHMGKTKKAIEYLDSLIKDIPEYAQGYVGMGIVYFMRGERKRALSFFTKAMEKDPSNPVYQNLLKKVEIGSVDMKETISKKVDTIDILPQYKNQLDKIVERWEKEGPSYNLLNSLYAILQTNPENPYAVATYSLYHLQWLLYFHGLTTDLEKESQVDIKRLHAIVEQFPHYQRAWFNLGLAYELLIKYLEEKEGKEMSKIGEYHKKAAYCFHRAAEEEGEYAEKAIEKYKEHESWVEEYG